MCIKRNNINIKYGVRVIKQRNDSSVVVQAAYRCKSENSQTDAGTMNKFTADNVCLVIRSLIIQQKNRVV